MNQRIFVCLSATLVLLASPVVAQRPGTATSDSTTKTASAAKPTPVKLKDNLAQLSPENTKVEFVGTHVGDEPKPRLGGFQKFKGKLTMNEDGTRVESLTMDFQTDSLWTQIGNALTTHLKNEDFLDVNKYPTAKFSSKSIKDGEKGTQDIVGDFTLMGKTNEITIPVTVKKTDDGVLVTGDFMIDRISFGMSKMADRVSKEVSIKLSIGDKTTGAQGGGQAGGRQAGGRRGQGGRGGRGGGRNPETMFKTQDANSDGKLTGDEIPEFLRGRMDVVDQDGDEAITLEEIQKMIESRRGGGRPGGGGR